MIGNFLKDMILFAGAFWRKISTLELKLSTSRSEPLQSLPIVRPSHGHQASRRFTKDDRRAREASKGNAKKCETADKGDNTPKKYANEK
jgi:hypothetical protein